MKTILFLKRRKFNEHSFAVNILLKKRILLSNIWGAICISVYSIYN